MNGRHEKKLNKLITLDLSELPFGAQCPIYWTAEKPALPLTSSKAAKKNCAVIIYGRRLQDSEISLLRKERTVFCYQGHTLYPQRIYLILLKPQYAIMD